MIWLSRILIGVLQENSRYHTAACVHLRDDRVSVPRTDSSACISMSLIAVLDERTPGGIQLGSNIIGTS